MRETTLLHKCGEPLNLVWQIKKQLNSAIGSATEMEVHVEIAKDLDYWQTKFCQNLSQRYQLLGGKINNLEKNWKTF